MSVVFSQSGPIGRLTIDRPQRRNALDTATIELLLSNLSALSAMSTVHVVILTGAGDRVFCAGGDLSSMTGEGFLSQHVARGGYRKLLEAIDDFPKPIIARVNGDALGGGLGLALACDLVVAVDGARFGTPEVKLGLYPMMLMALLLRHLPRKKATELMFTGGKLSASEALELNMINQVSTAEAFDEAVDALAHKVASFSPATLGLGKQSFQAMQGMGYREALTYLHTMLTLNANLDDAVEGVTAFFQKRSPDWKGR